MAVSLKATSKATMKRIISDNAKTVHTSNLPQSYIVNTEELLQQMQGKYTGRGYNLRTFLEFMSAEVSVCPSDTVKALNSWGFPPKNQFAQCLKRYAERNDKPGNKAWGKVASTLFGIFAATVWPNKSGQIKPKGRHYYGMKLLDVVPNESNTDTKLDSPPSTPSTTSWGSQSTTTTSSRTMQRRALPSVKRRRKTLKKTEFQPYYDVLQNPQTYVVRVFLPLVTPKEIKKVQIDSNLAQKSLSISGSYIPGNNIGQNLIGLFNIRRPLEPIFYADDAHYGPFQLHITLPNDIKDDEDAVKVAHESWGLAFQYTRRQQVEQASIKLSSCFGTCNINSNATKAPPSTTNDDEDDEDDEDDDDDADVGDDEDDDDDHDDGDRKVQKTKSPTTQRSKPSPDATTQKTQTRTKPAKKTTHSSNPSSAAASQEITSTDTPKPNLLGRSVSVEGSVWGSPYAGKQYHGTITEIIRHTSGPNKDFDTYHVKFDDCTDQFSLSDMLQFRFITQEEHDLLFDSHQF